MKKLLLQTAIAALVSTGVASSVMAATAPALATANVTLQGNGAQPPTATAKFPLNLVLPIKTGVTASDFGTGKSTSVQLSTLYDTATASSNSGCVEITNVDLQKANGGITAISVGSKLALVSATSNALLTSQGTKLDTNLIIKKVTLVEGGSCLAAKPASTASGALPSVTSSVAAITGNLTLTSTEIGKTGNPSKNKIAVYYQLDATALGNLLLDATKLSYNDNESLTGSLAFTLTL